MSAAIKKPTEVEVKAAAKLRKAKKNELYAYGYDCRYVKKGDTYTLIYEECKRGEFVDRPLIPVLPFNEFHAALAIYNPLSVNN